MKADPPSYVGRTRPSAVGWTRMGLTAAVGLALAALPLSQGDHLRTLLTLAIFALLTGWTWTRHHSRFVVDERGLTVSLGGFWRRRPWPLEDFRTVQLRELPQTRAGATVGGYGWRQGTATTPRPEELTAVGKRGIRTLAEDRAPYRSLVTRPGTMVEIIGRGRMNYLISPVDPKAAAAAVDQAIRSRR